MKWQFFPSDSPDDSGQLQHPAWRDLPVSYSEGQESKSAGWDVDRWERELSVPGVAPEKVFEQARARLINFDILPARLAQFTTTWNVEGRLPQPGDIVFQRTHFLYVGNFHLIDILSATRVKTAVDAPDYFLLQYVTTQGHPEQGTARYELEKTAEGKVIFRINALSKPALFLTRLAKPIITRRVQLKLTQGILDTLEKGVRLDLTAQEEQG